MKEYSVCLHTLIPVRKTESECSEMVTQIVFGETYTVTNIEGNWAKVIISYDNYTGWIDAKLINYISKNQFIEINLQAETICSMPLSQITNLTTSKTIPIVGGSSFSSINSSNIFNINNVDFEDKEVYEIYKPTSENIVVIAKKYINAPYLWGGKSILGIDCSGFTQIVYKIVGVPLNRDASQQAKQGNKVLSIKDALPGDLAFFDNNRGHITHVGIIISNKLIIHASGWVRIDKIDEKGIFNSDTNTYSHKLSSIRRLLN